MHQQESETRARSADNIASKLSFGTKQFGELLIEAGVIDREGLTSALEHQRVSGERLGEALVSMGLAAEGDIVNALARQLDIGVFRPADAAAADHDVVLLVPEHVARRHHVIATSRVGNTLLVAVRDPLDLVAIDDVRMATGLQVALQVGRQSDIDEAIGGAYRSATADHSFEQALEGADLELGLRPEPEVDEVNEQELRSQAEDAPIVRLVNLILGQAISERATDIHIEPLEERVVVRYRVDGVLYDSISPPRRFHDAIVVRIKILADMDVAERRVPLDGRFTARFESRDVDIRVSTLPTIHGEKVVMRLLNRTGFSVTLADLGFEAEMMGSFRKSLERPYGMILISGPTGSGKTTSLYSGLSELDHIGKNITTLEDPVEYRRDRITQVSINPKAGMTFGSGLRSILRQDPDVIMIGEIRDTETAELAVRSALTGHLVLSTVHANDAASTTTRLIDIGIEPYLVTSALAMVMAQRLVRRICPDCKEAYESEPLATEVFGPDAFEGATFYRGTGCKQCKGRGFHGRTGVFEVLELTPEMRDLVRHSASADVVRQRAVELGFTTLRDSAIKKVRDGITTVQEAVSVCAEVD